VKQLIVKAAKGSAGGGGVIVLKKSVFDAEVYEFGVVVSFEERAARVAMDYGAQLIDTWQGRFDSFHLEEYYARWFYAGNFAPEPAIAFKEFSRLS
jgi:hypothetical protein